MKNNIKIITKYWGVADLRKIKNYESFGGYKALQKYIREMNSEKAIKEIKKSGLVGRGGAGYLSASRRGRLCVGRRLPGQLGDPGWAGVLP